MRLVHTYKTFYQTYDVTCKLLIFRSTLADEKLFILIRVIVPGEAPNLFLWTNLELQVALICASIPALKVFLKHYKESTIGTKLSYELGKYRSGTSKSTNSQTTPKAPGFYTQALSSDIKQSSHIIEEHDGTIVVSKRTGPTEPSTEYTGRRKNQSPV
jgi:hypothetical protein